ncbi:MAG: hypothetical protein A4E47_01277 [Methanosaeta sp. PtaU1.Bin028]|nr:MAG: hypothetical protein A4E47_01277 [Methanosaeta sp. PtaU1.Bin028]
MSFDPERIYSLLPAIYRNRDAVTGKPLKGLLSVIAEQIAVLDEDLSQLYDDLFIETCAEWAVPYIGDLIGFKGVYQLTESTFSQRSQVANTIAYRRRKGTVAVLEQLARDVTGWDARVVEFFQLLATTQYMNHLRPGNIGSPDMRRSDHLEWLNTPFESTTHTADVRRIAINRGKYNIPNVGIFLWRVGSHSQSHSPASRVDKRRYRFNSLGADAPLYNLPQSETDFADLAEPLNVPMPLGKNALDRDLRAHYSGDQFQSTYYGNGRSFCIWIDGQMVPINKIAVCDLSDAKGGKWAHAPPSGRKIAIDPDLGRMIFDGNMPAKSQVCVSYHYGFSADIGGGEYPREGSFISKPNTCSEWGIVQVRSYECHKEEIPAPPLGRDRNEPSGTSSAEYETSVQSGINAIKTCGVIEIADNGAYKEAIGIDIPSDMAIELRAANMHRPSLILKKADGSKGWPELVITGGRGSKVSLNGLLISDGGVRIKRKIQSPGAAEDIKSIRIQHCTLVPGISLSGDGRPKNPKIPSLIIEAEGTEVEIDRCILGGIRAVPGTRISITNSIIDATSLSGVAFSAPNTDDFGGTLVEVKNSTIIGKVRAESMELVSNTILMARLEKGDGWEAPVWSFRRQNGCVRFSYLPEDSKVPRRYRCQPDLAAAKTEDDLLEKFGALGSSKPSSDKIKAVVEAERSRVVPLLSSMRYGKPNYCQLSPCCSEEIRRGADDESEMGAFHDLFWPQRETNLRVRLNEYLRFGLDAGIFYPS